MHAESSPEPAQLALFGHAPTPVRLDLESRSFQWRLRRTLTALGTALLVAPVVFILPPHVPWALAALAAGAFIARRRWTERFTIRSLEGECPRCGAAIMATEGERLRVPHTLSCEGCNHECTLEVG